VTRRLALRREHLTELTPYDLSSVAGGTSRLLTGYYPSLNAPCTEIVERVTTVLPGTG
jgi:hypothetical protein